jgi:hypothetical protein
VYRSKPLHDWASHPADAFRTLAMGLRANNPSYRKTTKQDHAGTDDYSPC